MIIYYRGNVPGFLSDVGSAAFMDRMEVNSSRRKSTEEGNRRKGESESLTGLKSLVKAL